MPTTDRDWIKTGAQVAEYTYGTHTDNAATITTVERVTATQVVLANGRRYRLDTLRPVGEKRGSWSGWTELRSPSDASVIDALAVGRYRIAMYKVNELRQAGIRDADSAAAALALIASAVNIAIEEINALAVAASNEAKDGA